MGRKKGRRMVYAFESMTSGKTWSVPFPGPVSLQESVLGWPRKAEKATDLSASHPWKALKTVAWKN